MHRAFEAVQASRPDQREGRWPDGDDGRRAQQTTAEAS